MKLASLVTLFILAMSFESRAENYKAKCKNLILTQYDTLIGTPFQKTMIAKCDVIDTEHKYACVKAMTSYDTLPGSVITNCGKITSEFAAKCAVMLTSYDRLSPGVIKSCNYITDQDSLDCMRNLTSFDRLVSAKRLIKDCRSN